MKVKKDTIIKTDLFSQNQHSSLDSRIKSDTGYKKKILSIIVEPQSISNVKEKKLCKLSILIRLNTCTLKD